MILHARENFSPLAAGAISLIAERFARVTPGAVVIGFPYTNPTFQGIAFRPARNTLAIFRLLRRLQPESADVYQSPRLAMWIARLFPKTRVILNLQNDPLMMRGLKSVPERQRALRRLHCVACNSEYLRSRYMTGLTGPGPAVLYNPLTLAALPPRAAERRPEILFVGRIVRDKGPDVFISAAAQALPQLPGWSARLLGGDRFGPDSPQTPFIIAIAQHAAAAGIAIYGPVPHAEVLNAMAQAAIVVVPSRWAEPFGLTALEAMASGAVLITTPQGGLPEVGGGAAVYVTADDPGALAEAIVNLAQNPALRTSHATAGLTQARLFDTPIIAARLAYLRNARPAV